MKTGTCASCNNVQSLTEMVRLSDGSIICDVCANDRYEAGMTGNETCPRCGRVAVILDGNGTPLCWVCFNMSQ